MKKIIALLLSAVMICGCASGLAETTKHERVYIVAAADGTVQSVTDSIRLENADGLEEIHDQTLLTAIENVGGKEPFTLEGQALTWQAGGKDIIYQGTSDKVPAVLPVVTLTLDGKEITAEALKDLTGEAVLTVSYQTGEALPALALSVLPLPASGVSDWTLENAAVLSEMGRQVLVGWAVPGIDPELNLPASFTASFHADHADLGWMMTVASADPINAISREIEGRVSIDPHAELTELEALLTALQSGEALPETTGLTKNIAPKLNELNSGLKTLNSAAKSVSDGAGQVMDGASSLKTGAAKAKSGAAELNESAAALAAGVADAESGAAALDGGLAALTTNNQALNDGVQALLAAVLRSANDQLSTLGVSAELMAENYAETLDALLGRGEQLSQAAREGLTGLKAQLDQVSALASGLQSYTDGVSQAAAGASALHEGLIQVSAGAADLSAGAETLAQGTTDLSSGAASLYVGAIALRAGAAALQSTGTQKLRDTLLDAEKQAAEKLLPYVQDQLPRALRVYEETRDSAANAGYDLRPAGMNAVTVYVIRTDLQ